MTLAQACETQPLSVCSTIADGSDNFPALNEFIIKLTSRCNIRCRYCYWFEDPEVLKQPKRMSEKVWRHFVERLAEHIERFQLERVDIALHGGEPALFPSYEADELCRAILKVAEANGCRIQLSMQSNGLLLDNDWRDLIQRHSIQMGVSLDGNQLMHDANRIDHRGRGTFRRTIQAVDFLRQRNIPVHILSVIHPQVDVDEFLTLVVKRLAITELALLLPHSHHDMPTEALSEYLCHFFDRYLDYWVEQGLNIRFFDDLMATLLGGRAKTEGWGYITTATLNCDGGLEATDDLRMAPLSMKSGFNVMENDLQRLTQDPLWQEVYYQSFQLATPCLSCELKNSCGGGPLVSRWSASNRFANPSVYCQTYQKLLAHMESRLRPLLEQLKGSGSEGEFA